jgi:hypothetical protein
MYDSSTTQPRLPPVPGVGLRIAVMERRYRFAALLSRFSGQSIERAWRAFRPLTAPDGVWGVPTLPEPGEPDRTHGSSRT